MSSLLHIRLVEGTDFPNMDLLGGADPYCILSINNEEPKFRSRTVSSTLTPVWNEEFHLDVTDVQKDSLVIQVFDEDFAKSDDMISELKIPLNKLDFGAVTNRWHKCTPAEEVEKGGRLHLQLHLATEGSIPFKTGSLAGKASENIGSFVNNQSSFAKNILAMAKKPEKTYDELNMPPPPPGMLAPWMIQPWMLLHF